MIGRYLICYEIHLLYFQKTSNYSEKVIMHFDLFYKYLKIEKVFSS